MTDFKKLFFFPFIRAIKLFIIFEITFHIQFQFSSLQFKFECKFNVMYNNKLQNPLKSIIARTKNIKKFFFFGKFSHSLLKRKKEIFLVYIYWCLLFSSILLSKIEEDFFFTVTIQTGL